MGTRYHLRPLHFREYSNECFLGKGMAFIAMSFSSKHDPTCLAVHFIPMFQFIILRGRRLFILKQPCQINQI